MRNHRCLHRANRLAMPWATATVAAAPAPVTWEELRRLPEGLPGHLRQRLASGHQRRRVSPGQGPPRAG